MSATILPFDRVTDSDDNPVSGAILRFYDVGTLTAKTVYSNVDKTDSLGTYLTCDSEGRFTQFYSSLPLKVRVEQSISDSTLLFEYDHLGQDISDVDTQTEGLLTIANVQNSVGTYGETGGSANAYTLTPSQAITTYAEGQFFKIKANHANTGAATINISNVGVIDLQDNTGGSLNANTILSGGVYTIMYDGGAFKLVNTIPANNPTITTNTINELTTGNGVSIDGATIKDGTVFAHSRILSFDPNTTGSNDYIQFDEGTNYLTGYENGVAGDMNIHFGDATLKAITADSLGGTSVSNFWHSGNDGSGSGLDADLLDNIQSSSFVRSDQDDIVNGLLIFSRSAAEQIRLGYATGASRDAYLSIYDGLTTRRGYIEGFSTGIGFRADAGCQLDLYGSGDARVNGNKVFHAGNDGADSGLDADTVDGVQASAFAQPQTLSWTPQIRDGDGSIISQSSVTSRAYRIGDLVICKFIANMGTHPTNAQAPYINLPVATDFVEDLGLCWSMYSTDPTGNVEDLNAFTWGTMFARGSNAYFKNANKDVNFGSDVDTDWMVLTMRYLAS